MARKSRRLPEALESGRQSENTRIYATAIYARLSVENSGKDDDGAALYVRNTSGLARICARPTSMLITGELELSLTVQRSTG